MGVSIWDNLAPALIQCFATILLGYVFGRFNLIPENGMKAMGMFVTMVALPSLLLRNMAVLDLHTIEWDFFIAIFFAKTLLFACVVACTLLKVGFNKKGLSDAGIFAIYVTQSNDFAIGLPILTALFSVSNPSYPFLLYVMSPVSLLLLNPIGFILMEYGREPTKPPGPSPAPIGFVPRPELPPGGLPESVSASRTSSSGDAILGDRERRRRLGKTKSAIALEKQARAAEQDHVNGTDHSLDVDDHPPTNGSLGSVALMQSFRGKPIGSNPSVEDIIDRDSSDEEASGDEFYSSDEDDSDELASPGPSTPPNGTDDATNSPVSSEPKKRTVRQVLGGIMWKVITNPVVFCSMLGIVYNGATGGSIPIQVDAFLVALGDTFSALALFVLGVNMNGKLALFQDRRKLFTPLLLIVAKSIVLPILLRLFLGALGVSGESNLTMCAFVVGTLPTAPSTHFFAVLFGAQSVELIAPAMILGTFVAAPIMFVSAQMVTTMPTISVANTIISDSTRIAAGFGFLGASYCLICFFYNKRWRSIRERLLITLCAFQAMSTLSVQFCIVDMGGVGETIRFWCTQGSQYGIYLTTAMMAGNELVRRYHGWRAEKRMYKWYNLCIFLTTFLSLGGLTLWGTKKPAQMPFEGCWNAYGQGQWILSMIIMCACFVLVVGGMLMLREVLNLLFAEEATGNTDLPSFCPVALMHEPGVQATYIDLHQSLLDGGTGEPQDFFHSDRSVGNETPILGTTPMPSTPLFAPAGSSPMTNNQARLRQFEPPFSLPPPAHLASTSSPSHTNGSTVGTNGSPQLQPSSLSRTSTPPLAPLVSPTHRSSVVTAESHAQHAHRRGLKKKINQIELESFWLFAMKIQLFLSASSMFLCGALQVWSNDTNGIRIEMMLLDSVVYNTMGVYTIALFAFRKEIDSPLRPLKRLIRKLLKACSSRSGETGAPLLSVSRSQGKSHGHGGSNARSTPQPGASSSSSTQA